MPTHYQGTPEEVLALDTFIKLNRATESLGARLIHGGTLGNLTESQFGVMETIFHLGPLCLGEISAKLLKSGGNITLVIDNLEKQGLVRRERDVQDRRMVFVSLTPEGEALIKQVLPVHIAAIVAEINTLTPEEQQILGRLCRKLGKKEEQAGGES